MSLERLLHRAAAMALAGVIGLAAYSSCVAAAAETPSAEEAGPKEPGPEEPGPVGEPKGKAEKPGLNRKARRQLRKAGLTKYLYKFEPTSSEPFNVDWTKHTFDSAEGEGPVCIGGTDYSMFTKQGDPDKLIVFLQGGGACWENFNACNTIAEAQFPPPAAFLPGIFSQSSPDGTIPNRFADWSVAYLPYCDGSVFIGDNDVENDPVYGTRRHRGLRNLSAGMSVARKEFGRPKKVLVAGSSAGGAGSAVFAPFLARFVFGNRTDLSVFNDAGPIALDVNLTPDAARARVNDWKYTQFFPRSCVKQGLCDPFGRQTGFIEWRLDNDSTIREAFYETDGDQTNIGFVSANVPGFPPFLPVSQFDYRMLIDREHDPVNAAHPQRYKRFVVSGGNPLCDGGVAYTHTALQGGGSLDQFGCSGVSLYYDLKSDGTPLYQWAEGLAYGREVWRDIVEPFTPAPALP